MATVSWERVEVPSPPPPLEDTHHQLTSRHRLGLLLYRARLHQWNLQRESGGLLRPRAVVDMVIMGVVMVVPGLADLALSSLSEIADHPRPDRPPSCHPEGARISPRWIRPPSTTPKDHLSGLMSTTRGVRPGTNRRRLMTRMI